jgi:hypothetical protein
MPSGHGSRPSDASQQEDPEQLWTRVWALTAMGYAALVTAVWLTPTAPRANDDEAGAPPRLLVELAWPRPPHAPIVLQLPEQCPPPVTASLVPTTLDVEPPEPPSLEERSELAARLAPPDAPAPATTSCLTAEQVQPTVARMHRRARACYEERLRRSPTLAGTIDTTVLVDAAGNVATAQVTGGTLEDGELSECLLAALEEQSFPACEDGMAEIRLPWTFARAR